LSLADNLQRVRLRIAEAARRHGRDPAAIRLLAVSKTQPAAHVREAFAAGQSEFGENYVQEALEKMAALADLPLTWHFIGPIQSNKTRAIAEHFAWVHSIDRIRIAERLSRQRPAGIAPLDACIEVNISQEPGKRGVAPEAVLPLARAVADMPGLRLRGLMAIPAPVTDFDAQRAAFGQMRRLFESLRAAGLALDTLSMGMSADLEAAIAEGATLVRVGTAIFGERKHD
jgi:hypothetical protein